MFEKAGILGSYESIDKVLRYLFKGNHDSLLFPESADHLTIIAVYLRYYGRIVLSQRAYVGEITGPDIP
jgi:hypothetical protein